MSYYNKYNFTSPEPVYAIIKEELKSYFDTGMVDDLLFPTYLNKCLDKLGKSSYAIVPVVLFVEDFTATLPDNFFAIREAWFCASTLQSSYTLPSAFYTEVDACKVTEIGAKDPGDCNNPVCDDPICGGGCLPSTVQSVYKVTRDIPRSSITRKFLLKPGNISFSQDCPYDYNNNNGDFFGNVESYASGSFDSFDLRDNKFVTTFRNGIVEVLMYASDHDCIGNQMMPDNFRIKEYIELFIKFKVFETIFNQTTDETYNQSYQKMELYKRMSDEAYIMAESEIKKQTAYTKQRRIKKLKNKLDMYELPTRGYGKRRNNY